MPAQPVCRKPEIDPTLNMCVCACIVYIRVHVYARMCTRWNFISMHVCVCGSFVQSGKQIENNTWLSEMHQPAVVDTLAIYKKKKKTRCISKAVCVTFNIFLFEVRALQGTH